MSLKEKLGLTTDPLYLMDGTAFIFRAFFVSKMQRSDGFPTNALTGVARLLLRILREEKPKYFLFIRDGHEKNFRHEFFSDYKANRDATPEDLQKQVEPISRLVQAFGIPEEVTHGFEADDCMASLAHRFAPSRPVIIISGDKDLKQCLGDNVYIWNLSAKEEQIITAASFTAETGIAPEVWPDVQALIGDSVDNIPGVPGIGIKTALQIFSYCSSLEEIRDHFDRLPLKFQKKLKDHLQEMFDWRKLTRLSLEYEPKLTLEQMEIGTIAPDKSQAIAREFELITLLREIDVVHKMQTETCEPKVGQDLSQDVPNGRDAADLLDLPKPVQVKSIPVEHSADLPNPSNAIVALIGDLAVGWGLHLALLEADQVNSDSVHKLAVPEYVWQGSVNELGTWLKGAKTIVVEDLKAFFKASSAWYDLMQNDLGQKVFDLSLACYLLHPEDTDFSWNHLENRWALPFQTGTKGKAALGLDLYVSFQTRLANEGLTELYQGLELPLVKVLADMEMVGIAIDLVAFKQYLQEVEGELAALTNQIYTLSGTKFNIRSAQQLGNVLFTVLKLKGGSRTKGGKASTSQQTLEKLAGEHPVVDAVLKFRKLEKMRSTYLDPLPKLADKNGRVHTNFNQKATATGRLSSSDPNLQNIPARGELGQRIRAAFVARDGFSLISSDYSQIELRVLAHMSGEKTLIEAFSNDRDIHAHTAHLIYNVPLDAVTAEQRRVAKTINFGLIYGMGAQKLAQELTVSLPTAKEFIANYFASLPGLKTFYDRIVHVAKAQGYVLTLGGRRRTLPDLASANNNLSSQASRQAINTSIQGSAADIIKIAMLHVAMDQKLQQMQAKLLLQVHDELVLEVPTDLADEAGQRVAYLMENVTPNGQKLDVALKAEWGVGHSWGEAH